MPARVIAALALLLFCCALPVGADDKPDLKSSKRDDAKKREAERKARQKTNKQLNQDLAKKLGEAIAKHEKSISGVVHVVKDGLPLYSAAFGMADRDSKRKNALDTFFDTGSVTKQFTAAAVLKLEMLGKLKLADRIDKHFKNVPADKAAITVLQLLSHSSGVAQMYDFEGVDVTDRDSSVKCLLAIALAAKPGEKFIYSNANYFMAAALVEIASGQSFESFCEEHLFKPAGMKDTGFTGDKDLEEKRSALRYEGGESRGSMVSYAYSWGFRGATGVVSTVSDMNRWSDALLGDDVLNAEARKSLFKPVLSEYACGWYILKTATGSTKITHSGAAAGARCYFSRYEAEDVAFVIFLNECTQGSLVEFTLANEIDAVLFAR